MKDYIKERVLLESNHIISTHDTLRAMAPIFGVSKSTVHIDITRRILKLNPKLAVKVRAVLDQHLDDRAILGGLAVQAKKRKN